MIIDPQCVTGKDDLVVLRGGSWASASYELHGAFRASTNSSFQPGSRDTQVGPHIGFRCARAGDL